MSDEYRLPKLSDDNYHAWAIRARAALVQKRCWDAIEPGYGTEMTENEMKKNDEALTLLFLIVEDTFLDDIGDCIRARDAWNSLREMNTKFGLLHILQLMRDFFNTNMKHNETVKSYLGRLMEIHRKLSGCGYAFTDREVALIMLMGLPKSFESLILNLEQDEANLSTTTVKSRLLVEEKRITRNEISDSQEEKALQVKNFNPSQKKTQFGKSSKKWPSKRQETEIAHNNHRQTRQTRCFSCGEWGHISKNCDEAKHNKQSTAKKAIDQKHWALKANEDEKSAGTKWILDSGATDHMTSDHEKFVNLKDFVSAVEIANSEKIEVTGIGDIMLSISDNSAEDRKITLANVLYVPGLGGSLLSVGRIEQLGFEVKFADGEARITEKEGQTILTAKRRGRLYVIDEKTPPTSYIARTENKELWHRRLGHLHYNAVKEPLTTVNENKSNSLDKPCSVCIQAKMKKKKFPKAANTHAKEVLEIIHTDVAGKITPSSLGGSKYFVSFTDDFSRYTSVFPMKTKDEVLLKFDEYRRRAENFHGKRIKILRSDNGGEYKNESFDEYLAKLGIQRQLTVPESPQQNGIAERLNQTLINTARCLLIESGLDSRFWAEAVTTAAFLRNKCPSAAIDGDIPERIWTGADPKTEHLKVYGCRAWSHMRSYDRKGKFDPKAKECVLVGYPDGVKGYKLWDLKQQKFLVSRDVIFEEDTFPLKMNTSHLDSQNEEDFILCIENEKMEDDVVLPEVQMDEETSRNPEILNDTDQYLKDSDFMPSQNSLTEENSQDSETLSDEDQHLKNMGGGEEVMSSHQDISRRQARHRNAPKYLEDYVVYKAEETKCSTKTRTLEKDPETIEEALASPETEMWQSAMHEEIENLKCAQTWELVTKPPNAKIIKSRWIFRRKKDEAGNYTKFKARLVAKGYLQVYGIDFKDTFSPVIKLRSIRILLAMAVEMNFEIHQMDITAAYLNGTLEEDIYMAQPEGCVEKGREHLVCHLKKGLYGLRQSGRVWNSCLDKFLTGYDLRRSVADPCIYFNTQKEIVVGVYVDDLLIIGKIEEINNFKQEIKKRFTAKDLGPADQLLSMKISKNDDGSITLDQSAYVSEILEAFKMTDSKPASTPLDPNINYLKVEDQQWEIIKEESNKIPYRQVIGSLLYLACGTRPDLAHATTYMSQFNERPSEEHWRGVKHILRYLKGTRHRRLKFQKTCGGLQVFSDADWGGDRTDRKSYNGYILLLAGAPVSWSSKKQTITALSSTEAEYIAMCHVAKELLWVKNLFEEMCVNFVSKPQKVFVDNQGAMFMSKNRVTSERSKHIDIKYFFLRDLVLDKVIEFEHISSNKNVADIMTKRVSKKTLCELDYAMTSI